MLKKRTVFVVGAGCSREFGLPLGSGLRDEIFRLTSEATSGSQADAMMIALMHSGIPQVNVNVSSKLKSFGRGLYGKQSIDQYLDFHRDDLVQVAIGKSAIAEVILRAEEGSKLAATRLDKGMADVADTWLGRLFQLMNEGVALSNIESLFKNVSFVCFNYDRCIEAFFLSALQSLSQRDFSYAAHAMRKLRIWHPYGTVGPIEIASLGANPLPLLFGQREITAAEILDGMRELRTFTEGMREDAPERDEILGALHDAEQVVFMGFSFLAQNMALLSLDGVGTTKRVFATTMGLPLPDVSTAKTVIEASLQMNDHSNPRQAIEVFDGTAADLISYWGRTLAS